MEFLLGNHSLGSSNSDNSSESKENMKPSNQKKEDKVLINKKRNREIANVENSITSGEKANGKYRKSNHEMHLSVEREKRKNLNNMFDTLQALLPRLPFKPNKATIVDETVNYIKYLEQTLEKLEKQKQERPKCVLKEIVATSKTLSVNGKQKVVFNSTWAASNMVLNIHGDEAQFTICSAHKAGLMTIVAYVLEKHNIEIITGSISRNDNGNTCMIQVHGKRASDANSVEESYRHVAEEIMSWIS